MGGGGVVVREAVDKKLQLVSITFRKYLKRVLVGRVRFHFLQITS